MGCAKKVESPEIYGRVALLKAACSAIWNRHKKKITYNCNFCSVKGRNIALFMNLMPEKALSIRKTDILKLLKQFWHKDIAVESPDAFESDKNFVSEQTAVQ